MSQWRVARGFFVPRGWFGMLEVSLLHILWVYSVLEFLNCLSQQTPVFPRVGCRGLLCAVLWGCCFGGSMGLWRGLGQMVSMV